MDSRMPQRMKRTQKCRRKLKQLQDRERAKAPYSLKLCANYCTLFICTALCVPKWHFVCPHWTLYANFSLCLPKLHSVCPNFTMCARAVVCVPSLAHSGSFVAADWVEPKVRHRCGGMGWNTFTKPPLLQESRLTSGGSPILRSCLSSTYIIDLQSISRRCQVTVLSTP